MSDPRSESVDNSNGSNIQQAGGAPPPPPPPPPPRFPSGDGYRDGEFRVSEPVASFFEKLFDTAAYVVTLVATLIGRAFRFIGEMILSLLELPAKALMLYPWGKHLLTLGARTTIIIWGLLIFAIGTWDGFVWSKTWAYVFTDRSTIIFASAIMAVFTILVERSFAVMATDTSIVRQKSLIARLTNGYLVMSVARIVILLILSIANGEAMRVQLSRDEIDYTISMHEADTNRQLHERRTAEIQAEMTRRRNEGETHAQSESQALTQRRTTERAQIASDRARNSQEQRASVRALDTDATQEMNGAFSGVRSVGPNVRDIRARQERAADALRAFDRETDTILREFDQETSTMLAGLSDQTTTRGASLNREQDRRLEELRHMNMDQLARQYGVHAHRANGFWARRDALEEVHAQSPSSKHGDWFAMVVLVGIGMLLFVAKKTAPHDAVVYYNIQAHAFADDDSPFCRMAKQTYAAMIQNDAGVHDLQREYLVACDELKREFSLFLAKMTDIAQSVDATGLHYPLPVAVTAVERAWFDSDARVSTLTESTAAIVTEQPSWPIRLFRHFWKPAPKQPTHSMSLAQHRVADIEFSADRARLSLPAHPASEQARKATSTVTYADLEALGWVDPTPELHHREGLRQEHEQLQQALVDSLIEFRKRFGRVIRPEDLKDAENEYSATIQGTALEFERRHLWFVNKQITPPAWIYGRDPLIEARSIESVFFRPNPPTTPSPGTSTVASIEVDPDEESDFEPPTPPAAATPPKLVVVDGGAAHSSHH